MDRTWERMMATQPGYIPQSQRPKQTVTHVREHAVGKTPVGDWQKTGVPRKNYEGEMVQQWYQVETLKG